MRLSAAPVSAAVAVRDIARARAFYEELLGLVPEPGLDDPTNVAYACGARTLLHVFVSPHAAPSGATLCGFAVDDVSATVRELRARGVEFDGEVLQFEGGVEVAYLRDPEGNVLSIATAPHRWLTGPGSPGGDR